MMTSASFPPGAAADPRTRVGFIVGPTGAGKTAFAIELAERLGAEIVNADSRQIYRGMDIGTAKPVAADRARVAHHLVDRLDPNQPINVAEFARLAREAIADIETRGKRAIVVGGSGLYLRVLRGGIFPAPAATPAIRTELAAQAARAGLRQMHERLREVDPEAAARIHPHDKTRILRALEVYQSSGAPISGYQRQHAFGTRNFDCLTLGLTLPRPDLYAAIDRRFDEMIAAGIVAEVSALLAAGYDPGAPPLSTIGYRELAAYLRGEVTLEAAVEGAKRESRRLAKRQLTWFRADREIVWIDPRTGLGEALRRFESFFAGGSRSADG
jgi:tRNA dimethylallyltransferase